MRPSRWLLSLFALTTLSGCEALLVGMGVGLNIPWRRYPEPGTGTVDAKTAEKIAKEIAAGEACLDRGDLVCANTHDGNASRLVAIRPGLPFADVLYFSGRLAWAGGNLAKAETLIGRGLRFYEKLAPESPERWRILSDFGEIARLQGDLPLAEVRLLRALTAEENGGDARRAAVARLRLGDVALARGETALALARQRRAIANLETIDPAGRAAGLAWQRLGRALLAEGSVAEARRALDRAAALEPPGMVRTLQHVETLILRGHVAQRRGNDARAEALYQEALVQVRGQAPRSLWRAEIDRALAALARRAGRLDEALDHYQTAAGAVSGQSANLGGSVEAQARFGSRYADVYRDWESLLVETGDLEGAFQVVEQARSKVLLGLYSVRHLRITRFLAEELQDQERRADAEYDQLLRRFATEAEPEARSSIERALGDARLRQSEARGGLRSAGVLVHVGERPTLNLRGTRRVLPPHTLLLVYSLGAESGRLYAVGPDELGLGVFGLPGEPEIRAQAQRLRDRIQARRSAALQAGLAGELNRAGTLLLGPVASRIQRARRVMIVPDGALHFVPFAVLPFQADRSLAEHVPSFVVPSVTFYHHVRDKDVPGDLPRGWMRSEGGEVHFGGSTRIQGDVRLNDDTGVRVEEKGGIQFGATPRPAALPSAKVVGFADPSYPAPGQVLTAAVRAAVDCGLRLDPLPSTRDELDALATVARDAAVWAGPSATEDKVKSLPRETSIVHLGGHGFVDERFPFESGIALSVPPAGPLGENGLLQAWEVLEDVRVDADLVVLSACGTGLGEEARGESALGLTWAFHHSGARAVLSSLWDVSDESSAALVRAFYTGLGAGLSKDAALRDAQLAVRSQPRWSAPYYWAGFQLSGAPD